MIDLFRALPALLRQMDDNETVRQAVVFAAWRKIAGDGLRDHAVPLRLYQKHLIVGVASETWKKHLEHLAGQMIFKLNSALEQPLVTFIEFRVDEETVNELRRKHLLQKHDDEKARETALNEVTPNMRRAADAIKDEELRYRFLLAAGSCLARKKKMQ